MTKDCTQPLRIVNIRALNGCAGRLFGAATLHNHKNSANKSNRKAMNRNWNNQKANPALMRLLIKDPDETAPLGLHCLPRHICPKH